MIDPIPLRARYLDLLEAHIGQPAHDPQSNAVKLLAYDMSRELEAGTISMDDLTALANNLSDEALAARARRLSDYVSEPSGEAAVQAFAEMVRRGATGKDGKPISFDAFCARWQRPAYGFVLTAHPTFSLSDALREVLAEIATAKPGTKAHDKALATLTRLRHQPEPELTLAKEHNAAQATLQRMSGAVDQLHRCLVDIARELYPLQWAAFRPAIATLATWVGYDLDGRSDINWWDSLVFRLGEKATQLARYAEQVKAILAEGKVGADAKSELEGLAGRLGRAATSASQEAQAFTGDLSKPKDLVKAANRLTDPDPDRLLDTTDILDVLGRAIIAESSDAVRTDLIVLAAAIQGRGLGIGHIHVRINAVQVHNALRAHLGWTGGGALDGRLPLENLTDEIQNARPLTFNFASLSREQTTAMRQMMLVARIATLIDRSSPVRYLIAECEKPITPLAVLYFAKVFGIDDRIDISPLFETPDALERGSRLIEQLIDNDTFRQHLKDRGRIAIQTGFSDAGRFIGQVTASLAVERLQVQLARLIDRAGLKGVEALVFDTHGESLGRGSHPGSLAARQQHLMTPWSRNWFGKLGISLKHESSFQGGDGFTLFQTDDLALRTVSGVLVAEHDWRVDEDDPFYADIAFTWDFYRALRAYQTDLYADQDYGDVVFAFAGQFLFSTGSRKARRAQESGGGRSDLSRLRAIPHNATLQQLGQLPHVSGGFGTAAAPEFDRFVELCRRSQRMRGLVEMISFARRQSSMTGFAAHGSVLDAGFWIARADAVGPGQERQSCLALAERLTENGTAAAFHRFHGKLRTDLLQLEAVLNALDSAFNPLADESRRALYLLHATRIALMMHVLLRAADLPEFAMRNDFTRDQVLDLLLHMRVPEAVELICETFPRRPDKGPPPGLSEEAEFGAERISGYPHIHDQIIAPIEQAYALMRSIGVGLSHRFGAYG